MIAIALGHLVPLGFVFAGLWDGRDVLVIFWIEFLIIAFYAMLRLTMMIGTPFWEDLTAICIWCVLLVFIWAGSGSFMLGEVFVDMPRRSGGMWREVGTLLNYSLARSGWVAVLVLIVVHGIEEVKRYRRSDDYRTLPKDIGMELVKRFVTLWVCMYALLFFSRASASMSMTIAVCLVAVRIAVEFWLGKVPASDSPPQEERKADIGNSR